MKHFGLDIPIGDEITNCTAPSGSSFPTNPNDGELFFHEGSGPTVRGMYRYRTDKWLNFIGPQVINDLDDVDTASTTPITDDALIYDGVSNWEPGTKEQAFEPSRSTYIATQGQTTFNHDYTSGDLMGVFLNGVKLVFSFDFVASSGTTIVLNVGANLNDIVEIFGYGALDIDHYTKGKIDERVLPDLADVNDDVSNEPNNTIMGDINFQQVLRRIENPNVISFFDRYLTPIPFPDGQHSNIPTATGRRNFVKNGAFTIQNNTGTNFTTDGHWIDNWEIDTSLSANPPTFTWRRSTFISDSNAKWVIQTASYVQLHTNPSNSDGLIIKTKVEEAHMLTGKPLVVSWRSKGRDASDQAYNWNYRIILDHGSTIGATVLSAGTFSINPNFWMRNIVTFNMIDLRTITTTNPFIRIAFFLDPGQTGEMLFTNVQCELGYVPSDFEHPNDTYDIYKSYRYYQNRNQGNSVVSNVWLGVANSSTIARFPLSYHPTELYAIPIPTFSAGMQMIDPAGNTFNVTTVQVGGTKYCGHSRCNSTGMTAGTPLRLVSNSLHLDSGFYPN